MEYSIIKQSNILGIIFIILAILLLYSNSEKFSHISTFPRHYIERCGCIDDCINSRCIYKSFRECQGECKRGCQFCGNNTWRCELQ